MTQQKQIIVQPSFHEIDSAKFKINTISINFITQMSNKTASLNALLTLILKQQCQNYPSPLKLNKKLKELYGAILNVNCQKFGDLQIISFEITILNDQFAFKNENLFEEAFNLLLNIVFKPKFNEFNIFPEKDVEIQKQNLTELIQNALSDKQKLATVKAQTILFNKKPCGTFQWGSVADVKQIDAQKLTQAYFDLLKSSNIHIITSKAHNKPNVKLLFDNFIEQKNLKQSPHQFKSTQFVKPNNYKAQTQSITDNIAQSILVMAFAADTEINPTQIPAIELMTVMLGGTPTSKLFSIIREKLSLCYYCYSQFQLSKKLIWVHSAMEQKNLNLAQTAIKEQLTHLKQGTFSEQEIAIAKFAIKNHLEKTADNLNDLTNFCLNQIVCQSHNSITDKIRQLENISSSDIKKAATMFSHVLTFQLTNKE